MIVSFALDRDRVDSPDVILQVVLDRSATLHSKLIIIIQTSKSLFKVN